MNSLLEHGQLETHARDVLALAADDHLLVLDAVLEESDLVE